MSVDLKPLDQQVIVITGASSGIGLATAEAAAKQGAKLVLAARSGQTLDEICQRIKAAGGQAIYVVADVAEREQVDARRRGRARRNSAASTPGSTTPACRSTAGSTRSPRRTAGASSTPTSGAWSTARSPRSPT